MMGRYLRGLLGIVGLLVLSVGVAALASPGLASAVPADALQELAGNDYLVVAAVGAFAFLLSVVALGGRTVSGIDQAEPPDPEEVWGAPRLGARFDRAVERGGGLSGTLFGTGRDEVRSRLREAAVEAEIRAEGSDRETARRAVDRGTWTDDEVAATFLAPDEGADVGRRLEARLRGSSWFERGTRRSVDAVVSTHERASGGER